MNEQLHRQLDLFRAWKTRWRARGSKAVEIDEDVLLVEPIGPAKLNQGSKRDFELTILALTHGIEVGGLGVVNECLNLIANDAVVLRFPMVVALGNVAAAVAEKRFVERDLNRSFASKQSNSLEERRAKVLESVLQRSSLLLDLHQTREVSPEPFFIYPFTKLGYEFSSAIAPEVPLVTRWDGVFSKEGMCSDEYINSVGGFGITLELGQNGFRANGVGVGIAAVLRAIGWVNEGRHTASAVELARGGRRIYTWESVLDYPENGFVDLQPHLQNFAPIAQGELVGTHEGQRIVAPLGGWVLFPQHYRDRSLPRPKELVRILREVSTDELAAQGHKVGKGK